MSLHVEGWGHDFEFYVHEEKYKLSYRDDNDEDSEQTKNRLVNALIYGYEVEKESCIQLRFQILMDWVILYLLKICTEIFLSLMS